MSSPISIMLVLPLSSKTNPRVQSLSRRTIKKQRAVCGKRPRRANVKQLPLHPSEEPLLTPSLMCKGVVTWRTCTEDAGPPVLKRGMWRQKTDDGGRNVCQEL